MQWLHVWGIANAVCILLIQGLFQGCSTPYTAYMYIIADGSFVHNEAIMKKAIKGILSESISRSNGSAYGIVMYSDNTTHIVEATSDVNSLVSQIDALNVMDSGSDTATELVEPSQPLNITSDLRVIVIFLFGSTILTQGIKVAVDKAKTDGVFVVAVGVDNVMNKAFQQELMDIASSNESVVHMQKVDAIDNVTYYLTCKVFKERSQNVTLLFGEDESLNVTMDARVADPGLWYKDGEVLIGNQSSASNGLRQLFLTDVQLSDAGTYTCRIRGKSTFVYLTVTVFQKELQSETIPIGGTVSLNVRLVHSLANISGVWHKDGERFARNRMFYTFFITDVEIGVRQLMLQDVQATDSGLYTFTVRDESTAAHLIVEVILEGLQNVTFSIGEYGNLTVQVDPRVTVNGQWFRDGKLLSLHLSEKSENFSEFHNLILPTVKPSDAGVCTYTISGDSTSAYVGVTYFKKSLHNLTTEVGDFVSLSVQVPDNISDSGEWYRDGKSIMKDVFSFWPDRPGHRHFNLTNAQPSDAGLYTFTFRGESSSAYLTVDIIIRHLENETIISGDNVSLSVHVTETVTDSGEWYKDGETFSREFFTMVNDSSGLRQLNLTDAMLPDAGLYTYTIRGQSTSAYLSVTSRVSDWGEWSRPDCRQWTCGRSREGLVVRNRTCDDSLTHVNFTACLDNVREESSSRPCGLSDCPKTLNPDRTPYTAVVFATVACVVVLVIVVVVVAVWIKKRKMKQNLPGRNSDFSIVFHRALSSIPVSKFMDVESCRDHISSSKVQFLETLGEGNFGKVMKARAHGIINGDQWDIVAVKVCKDSATDAAKEDFCHEIQIMRSLPKNVHVVNYLAFCAASDPILLILEFTPLGSLLSLLRSKRPKERTRNSYQNATEVVGAETPGGHFDEIEGEVKPQETTDGEEEHQTSQGISGHHCENFKGKHMSGEIIGSQFKYQKEDHTSQAIPGGHGEDLVGEQISGETTGGQCEHQEGDFTSEENTCSHFEHREEVHTSREAPDDAIEHQLEDHTPGKKSLTSKDLTKFIYEIAQGMRHLHRNKIIHRDLAARNILLGEGFQCKVSDFGLARNISEDDSYETKSMAPYYYNNDNDCDKSFVMGPLPIRWMSPESLQDRIYTIKSDVWSFGILIWEIVTLGASPYPGLSARQVIHSVRNGETMTKPDHCAERFYNMMTDCWQSMSEDRPDFELLSRKIEVLLEEASDYIRLCDYEEGMYTVINPEHKGQADERV